MALSERLLSLREQKGFSQEALAAELGVSRQAVSKWETGAATPDLDKVLALSEYYGVSTDFLLKGTAAGQMPPQQEQERLAEMPAWVRAGSVIPLAIGAGATGGWLSLMLGALAGLGSWSVMQARAAALPFLWGTLLAVFTYEVSMAVGGNPVFPDRRLFYHRFVWVLALLPAATLAYLAEREPLQALFRLLQWPWQNAASVLLPVLLYFAICLTVRAVCAPAQRAKR